MGKANIGKDASGRIVVSFSYDPSIVTKIRAIEGRRWHPVEKHWSFPNRNGTLERILEVLGNENVKIDPSLKGTVPDFVMSAQSNDLQTTHPYSPHRWRSEKEGVEKLESGLSPNYDFEDLRRILSIISGRTPPKSKMRT